MGHEKNPFCVPLGKMPQNRFNITPFSVEIFSYEIAPNCGNCTSPVGRLVGICTI